MAAKGATMESKKSWAVRTLLICFVCNGILVGFLLISKSALVTIVTGTVLTFALWLLILSVGRPPSYETPVEPVSLPASAGPAVQMLAAFQREGRLIDFLQEDLSGYDDGQIGAAVRSIQTGCKQALKEHMEIKPVFEELEGATVTIPFGFDTTSIRLTGNVTGQPPFRGVLRHRGWRAEHIRLPQRAEEKDQWILAPAEVEIES